MKTTRRRFFGAAIGAAICAPAIAKACAKPPEPSIWEMMAPRIKDVAFDHSLDAHRHYIMFGGRRHGKSMLAQHQAFAAMARGETVKMISHAGVLTLKPHKL